MAARVRLRGTALALQGVLVAVALGAVGLMAGDLSVEWELVACSELECLEPPLIGTAIGLGVGILVGTVLAVRGRGRPLFPGPGWAIVLVVGLLFVPFVLYSRIV